MTNSYDVAQAQQQPTKRMGMGVPILMTAAGAGAGALVNRARSTGMSEDEIRKLFQANDTVEIKSKLKGATEANIDEAIKMQGELKELEAKLAEAKKAVLPDTAKEAQEFRAVEKEVEEAIAKKTAEFEKLAGHSSGGTIDVTKLKKFADISSTDLPTVHPDSGKGFKGDELKNAYNNYTAELKNARTALDTKLNLGLRNQKGKKMADIETMISDSMTDLVGKDEEEIAEYFGDRLSRKGKPSKQYKRAMDIAEKVYKDPTALTDEQILEFATKLEPGETKPSGRKIFERTLHIKNDKGRTDSVRVWYKQNDYDNAFDALTEAVEKKRTDCADELFTELSNSCRINRDIAGLEKKVGKEISADLAKETGLYTVATDTLDMSKIIKLSGSVDPTYGTDINALQKIIQKAPKGTTPTVDAAIATKYGLPTTMTASDAVKQLSARNKVYKQYDKQLKGLTEELRLSKENNPIIKDFNTKIEETIANDKGVNKATEKLRKWFPNLFPEEAATSSTARKATIDDIGGTLKSKFERLKKAFEDASAKGGTVNEEAKKAAQEAVDAKSKSLNEMITKIGSESKVVKYLGGHKWIAPVVGAVILLAVGLGIRSSKNKQQG